MNILFMGTPDFAKESLEAIYNANYNILGVVTNADKPKGRGMKMIPSPVKTFAQEKSIEIFQPEKIKKNEEFIKKIKSLNPDIICVVAYGKILPKEILEIPKLGCINVHGSLLPQYRGAAPIQWAVLNGDKITGITTMYMDIGMDTGDMILKEQVEIGENETTGELWNRLSKIGGKLLVKTLQEIESGTVKRKKQEGEFSIAPMLNKEMAKINWNKSSEEIKNQIRGFNPIIGAYTFSNNKKIKIWRAEVVKENEFDKLKVNNIEKFENGAIIIADSKLGMYVKTGNGVLKVNEIQGENSKKMAVEDFLRGNKIELFEH